MNQPSIAHSQALFAQAQKTIPGGVNSPVRAFRSVGGTPRFFTRAQGAYLWDADGNRYVDTICSWGPAIVGHARPEVIEAVQRAAEGGLSFGAPTRGEVELAEWVRDHLPSMEMMRLTSSGTEATMSAIRVARGYTSRDKIVKFEGCYHGHVDSLLVKAGSGLLTFGNPTSAGVPASFANETIVVDYNDIEGIKACFATHGREIAAVIVEPIAGNMNLVRPAPGFLEALRSLCTDHGSVLIFDEVMTGFRVGAHGVQGLTGITPDLTTLGKVIGGGMPMGAFGGRRDIMQCVAPLGPVYQAGTLSGNPVAVAAGMATPRLSRRRGSMKNSPRPPVTSCKASRPLRTMLVWKGSAPTAWEACLASISAGSCRAAWPMSLPATLRPLIGSFMPCSTVVSISHPRPTRQAFSRFSTRESPSRRSSRRPGRPLSTHNTLRSNGPARPALACCPSLLP